MGRQMDEEAQLYWENITHLDPARNKMVEFLDGVSTKACETLQRRWKEGELTTRLGQLEMREDATPPGGFVLCHDREWENTKKKLPRFEIWVHDPRKSLEPGHYEVNLVCTKKQQSDLRRLSRGGRSVDGRPTVEAVAREHGLKTLEWDDDSGRRLCTDPIAINPGDSDETADKVADVAYRRLCMIVDIQNRILKEFGKEVSNP